MGRECTPAGLPFVYMEKLTQEAKPLISHLPAHNRVGVTDNRNDIDKV